MKVASVSTIREIETAVDASTISYAQMMLNAGRAAGFHLLNRLPINNESRITLLIGKGNNGGDGLVIAHYLAQNSNAQIRLYMLEARSSDDPNYQAVIEDNLIIATTEDDHDYRVLKNMINSADVIIDALFGIGIHLPLRDNAAKIARTVNQLIKREYTTYADINAIDPTSPNQLSAKPKPFVFAIDCPSGINCDTGEADINTISADETITFIAGKPGLFTFPAAKYVGKLIVSQIGIPDSQPELKNQSHFIIDSYYVKTHLPDRPADGHKGTFGKVFIVAGSSNYIGATTLSGESAMRSGTGLVTIATTSPIIYTIASQLREPTFIHLPDIDGAIAESATEKVIKASQGYNSLLIGCGLGQHPTTKKFMMSLLKAPNLPQLIIDADGLNNFAQIENWWQLLPENTIITPHPGEMSRLANISIQEINVHRWEIASQKAKDWNLIIVLKGAHTIIASPDGRAGVIPIKTDSLSTAGTGDVLAGLITGLQAQGLPAFESAVNGAYIHALAGIKAQERIGSSRSVIAGDVLSAIGSAFTELEHN